MEAYFKARIEIIGINPYVLIPEEILSVLFQQAGREKGPIPVCGKINGVAYRQTLVRYAGVWRLYINMTMLKDSPRRIGETVDVAIGFDEGDRSIQPHPKLVIALKANKEAKQVFDALTSSKRKEIVRYISALKTAESIEQNVQKAIGFLLGKNRFVGRDKP